MENHRIANREVANDVGISFGSCQAIISDVLDMRCVAGKICPEIVDVDQKQCRKDIAQKLLNEVSDNPELLKRCLLYTSRCV